MSDYSSFYLYRKYEVVGDELIDLGITSIDAEGTQEPVMKEECDPECGCIQPIYRWVVVPGGYECSGTTKMTQEKEQVSLDSGVTWNDVSPLTTRAALPVIEQYSQDCGYIPPTSCTCADFTYAQTGFSVSSAATSVTFSYTGCTKPDLTSAATYNWITIGNHTYDTGSTTGSVIANVSANTSSARSATLNLSLSGTTCQSLTISQESGATPGFDGKYKLILNDSSTVSAECDTSSITENEISAYSTSVRSVIIGNCCSSIGGNAFNRCTGLTSVTIPNSVSSIGNGSFYECTRLTSITIPDSVTSIGTWAFAHCSALTSVIIPSGVTSISNYTFADCDNLTSVTIPNGVTSIGEYAFNTCWNLTGITIPDSVTSIGRQAFYYCSKLTSITIPTGVTSIGTQAFWECGILTDVTVNATTPPTLGSGVFNYTPIAYGTGTIYVPCASVDAYKAATGWSVYASRIQGIPPCEPPTPTGAKFTLTLSDSSTVSAECDSSSAITQSEVSSQYSGTVVSAEIGDCVTSISGSAFYYCSGLTSVTIGTGVTNIESFAFTDCTSLTSITIPNSVTYIGEYAFYECTGLTSVTIGTGVTSIVQRAFYYCSELTSITVEATTPPTLLGNKIFDNTNNCPIYVPCESVDAYKAATGWSVYASRIQGIPPCEPPTPSYDFKLSIDVPAGKTSPVIQFYTANGTYMGGYGRVSTDTEVEITWQGSGTVTKMTFAENGSMLSAVTVHGYAGVTLINNQPLNSGSVTTIDLTQSFDTSDYSGNNRTIYVSFSE